MKALTAKLRQHFDWPLFVVALALMSAPVIQLARRPARLPTP